MRKRILHKSEIKSSLQLVYYTCPLIWRINSTKTSWDCQRISGYKLRNLNFATQSVLFTFILGPFNNRHITTLACGFWNLESTDTHSPHSLARDPFSFTCPSQQLLPLPERLKAQPALLIHTSSFHSHPFLCVTLSQFSGHRITTLIPKSFSE